MISLPPRSSSVLSVRPHFSRVGFIFGRRCDWTGGLAGGLPPSPGSFTGLLPKCIDFQDPSVVAFGHPPTFPSRNLFLLHLMLSHTSIFFQFLCYSDNAQHCGRIRDRLRLSLTRSLSLSVLCLSLLCLWLQNVEHGSAGKLDFLGFKTLFTSPWIVSG